MPHSLSPDLAQNDDEMPDAPSVETSTENNVKLEDMFNDDEDDEEFPTSGDVKMDSPAVKPEE
jgi:DNA primase small subunit